MNHLNIQLENSLLKLPSVSPRLKNYLKGWEESLKNFNDFTKEELKRTRSAEKKVTVE